LHDHKTIEEAATDNHKIEWDQNRNILLSAQVKFKPHTRSPSGSDNHPVCESTQAVLDVLVHIAKG
jgi:hypothetical protein